MIKEFKPTIFFLLRFLGIYLVGNLLYGTWITHWNPAPDPMTNWVTEQSAMVLNALGEDVTFHDHLRKPTAYISSQGKAIISVYEGCNGLNVMIVFIAFLFSFGPYVRALIWFAPAGLLIIHSMNLLRIVLLFEVSQTYPDFFYFVHKYLFTASIYVVVLLLWILWVARISKNKTQ